MTALLSKNVMLVALAVGIAGCLEDSPYRLRTTNPFNYKEVEWATKRGTNTVSGTIRFLASDGKTRPCSDVGLYPDSAYNREMFTILYGGIEDKVMPAKDMPNLFRIENSLEDQTRRQEDCGWGGAFSFRRVPDGLWYFVAALNPRETGSILVRRVELRGSQTVDISYP